MNTQEWSARRWPKNWHHGHPDGEWLWACCACSGHPGPWCDACEPMVD